MPSITGRLDQGRVLIDVGVQPTLEMPEAVTPDHRPVPIHITPLRGLIDTGAQVTCITRSAAASIGLVPRGKRRIGNVSSFEMHNTYSFVVGVWYVFDPQFGGGPTGYFQFEPIFGVDFKDNADFDVLIGMDVIRQGDFTIRRSGEFRWELG